MDFSSQNKEYTCGPACAQMVLNAFNIDISEEHLADWSGTNKKTGCSTSKLAYIFKKFDNLLVKEIDNAKFSDIQSLISQENIVIVNYRDPKINDGHFTIVKSIDSKDKIISFIDPLHGPNHKVPIETFINNWESPYENKEKWLLAVKRK